MRKFKKVSVKLIASLIAVIILISPINVLAAVISPKIDELLHSDEYIGASDQSVIITFTHTKQSR